MVSNINYGSIDATFPIAGKDNDSQGFRENFGYIKSGLQIAQGEITALQSTSASTSEDNSFNNNKISQAIFVNTSDSFFDGGEISTNSAVTFANGLHQKFAIAGTLTLTLGFPTRDEQLYKMRLELIGVDSLYSVGITAPGATIIMDNISNPLYVISSVKPRFFDIWTYDAGTTIYIHEVNAHDNFYDNGNSGSSDTFSFSDGAYQKYILTANSVVLTIGGFPPAGTAGKITLEITSSGGSARSVSFLAKNSETVQGNGAFKKSSRVPGDIQVASATNPIILEFWSRDGGNTVYMDYLGSFT